MTECGVQSYPNAKVIANVKIARYLNESASLKENSFAYFSWKKFEIHVSNLFCVLRRGLKFASPTCFVFVSY